MTPSEVGAILLNIVLDEQGALRNGLQDRKRIADEIAKGLSPVGHRVQWLLDTADALNDTLATQAAKFNNTYRADKISVHDMVDALATIESILVNECRKMGKK